MAAYAPTNRVRQLVRASMSIVMAMGLVVAAAAPSSASDSGDMVARINSSRAQSGAGRLAVHGELMAKAQEWSDRMASQGQISHSNVGSRVKSNWSKIAENVGVGSDTAQIHQMFMDSSGHRRNILDGDFQYVGVGTTRRDGKLYVAEIFMRLQDAASSGTSSAGAASPRTAAPSRVTTRATTTRSSRVVRPVPRRAAVAVVPPPKPTVPVRIEYSLHGLRGVTPD